MTVHVRMKVAAAGLRVGEDAALDGAMAKHLKDAGQAWITGGDAAELDLHGLTCDEEVGPAVYYPPGAAVEATIDKAGE